MPPHIQAAEHALLLVYESTTDNRREPVSRGLSGHMAGHGPGYRGGVCGRDLLALLTGQAQVGNLKPYTTVRECMEGKMMTASKPVVIEIPEEAYKQNTVYRPWPEIKAAETSGNTDRQHSRPR